MIERGNVCLHYALRSPYRYRYIAPMKMLNHYPYRLMRRLLSATALLVAVIAHGAPQVIDLDWNDTARGRSLPLKVRVPDGADKVPLVIFSHGLGGSREGGKAWGEYWAQHGYLVIHVQHPGSDDSLWKGAGSGTPKQRLARGATAEQMLGRVDDIRFVLDEITRQQAKADAPAWTKRINLARVAMTGHSFGARTTMALAGERFPGPIRSLAEPRISAFIAFSPTTQGLKRTWPERYGSMAEPFLSVTGSIDGDVMGTGSTASNRAAVFDAQPAGNKYRVVFAEGDHSVFGGGDLRDAMWLDRVTGQANDATPPAVARIIHDKTRLVTLKFLDAWLKEDAAARRWLQTDAAAAIGATGEWSAK